MQPNPSSLVSLLLDEQANLSAVERFAHWHESSSAGEPRASYRSLLPIRPPEDGQQYAFHVDLDCCSGCKACVSACHHLNGLDPDESWRSVGVLHGGTAEEPVQQNVTTACHHCIEPACMLGCPVLAYEKDPDTGIVIHLGDQCIGCQYCTLTCPYDVPKYSPERGIVRKCDMCSDRLAVGEAPACVQACPTEAIAITVVDTEKVVQDSEAGAFLPGTAPPGITLPTTTYTTGRVLPRNLLPADYYSVRKESAHPPLVVMLVLTQLSVGSFCVDTGLAAILNRDLHAGLGLGHSLVALAMGLLALAASTLHLGRPQYAWRAVLGLRTSWLSREILAFAVFAGLAAIYAGSYWLPRLADGTSLSIPKFLMERSFQASLGVGVATTGLFGVLCSVMVYRFTRREFWTGSRVAPRFYSTTILLGAATVLLTTMFAQLWIGDPAQAPALRSTGIYLAAVLICVSTVKLSFEFGALRHLRLRGNPRLKRAAVLMVGELRMVTLPRAALGVLGGILLPAVFILAASNPATHAAPLIVAASLIFLATLAAELLERVLFFSLVDAPKMPGGI